MKDKMLLAVPQDGSIDVVNILAASPFKNNIWSVINRLVIAATVYYVWQERN